MAMKYISKTGWFVPILVAVLTAEVI